MSYTINRMFKDSTFDNINARTRQALADHGFSVLTEIDVKMTMKKKLDVEMPTIDNAELMAVAGEATAISVRP